MRQNQLRWTWAAAAWMVGLLCQSARALAFCPSIEYRHASRPILFMISSDSTPIFKAAAKFEVGGADYLEIIADRTGIYLENQAGEVGLPVNILRTSIKAGDEVWSPPCRNISLFPGQRLLWTKWPPELQQIIDDREFVTREPINAEITVEIYR